ncbi:hypothetical protein BJ508DRAFT_358739 [Ascobolus immersus RN42]|uniref:F-box domain-containing protein n=1 Tax=Ascobolus immersus RN42 TaxID=1160509 RepID=A0A3N4IW12_ASCIM|nr:hypothetical protein BJ508DRAFT_358739 [Ascobolus immersus RN42]
MPTDSLRPTLITLPTEILHQIILHLPPPTFLTLCHVHPRLGSLTSQPTTLRLYTTSYFRKPSPPLIEFIVRLLLLHVRTSVLSPPATHGKWKKQGSEVYDWVRAVLPENRRGKWLDGYVEKVRERVRSEGREEEEVGVTWLADLELGMDEVWLSWELLQFWRTWEEKRAFVRGYVEDDWVELGKEEKDPYVVWYFIRNAMNGRKDAGRVRR